MNKYTWVIIVSFIAAAGFYAWQLAKNGPREIGQIENTHGIPFPKTNDGVIVVTEKLAHADVFLKESVLGKKLTLALAFDPGNLTKLEVGVRENSFWLSYPKVSLPLPEGELEGVGVVSRTIEIPLTDKLADRDGSIDVMFFATNLASKASEYEGVADKTQWHLHSINAEVSPTKPSWPEFKDFIKSIFNREKPI